MRRNFVKIQRQNRRDVYKKNKSQISRNRKYPAIYCINEKRFIAYSTYPLFSPDNKYKITKSHWNNEYANWRSEEYKINMENCKDGQTVLCPKCLGLVDFRIWISATKPEFI